MSAVPLTLGWIAGAVAGTLKGRGDTPVRDVVTDSRSMAAGDVFVALRGPRFDGHSFAAEALARGAAGVVVEQEWAGAHANAGDGVVGVGDTLQALQDLAHAVREASGAKVVAITGSAGKTTTKESIAALLATRFRVVKNKGNLNNHIGLPLSLMQLTSGPDVAVMELGMNHAGEIRTLVRIAEPDIRVWTNVGDAHLGFFASVDAIADAKAEILEDARPGDVLVCAADDARVMAHARAFHGRRVTFGESADADVRAHEVRDLGWDGMRARVATPAGAMDLSTPLLGRGNLANVLAATAVALECGVPLDVIRDTAATLRPADRRGVVHHLRNGVTLIDDSYNSSPAALQRALDVMARETRAAGRVAVLGEMLELGAHAIGLHEACGRAAAEAGLRLLVAVGGAPAKALAEAAVAAGMPRDSVVYFPSSAEAAGVVAPALQPGDLVLVKGSRGTRCDVVTDRIVQERG
ncbi:MAG TPA: UDP-N-acetylmuramoyl-tripeptide--D-alanyl-D-alanine ligase [Vicinamibacterales bacterium]|nr:UDP-N-acetylmuramoyl-tripeptide--D-alanyl-D-alanine ligase [Vicinamibacterales bacterium]